MDKNWEQVTPSPYPWERDAIRFIADRLPNHAPYHAWSNFEFIADDGRVYEVDLLVITPQGFFFVEIKSRPGRIQGDTHTWEWSDGRRRLTMDNPLILADRKAKRLASILGRQRAFKDARLPFLQAKVFCSDAGLKCDLDGRARLNIHLRDVDGGRSRDGEIGMVAAMTDRAHECPGQRISTIDGILCNKIKSAVNDAGIRRTQTKRMVGSYELKTLVYDGQHYQEWDAAHQELERVQRRVRIYTGAQQNARERDRLSRAAKREFQLLGDLRHAGLLHVENFQEHELGPALIFEYAQNAMRLDHFVAQNKGNLSIDTKLHLIRGIAETLKYTHQKKLYHRMLCPQNILVLDGETRLPHIKIMHWETAELDPTHSLAVSATSHLQSWLTEGADLFQAPESALPGADPQLLDVFSLGALSFYIFAETRPAESQVALSDTLRQSRGLSISAVMDGACKALQSLIQGATHPEVFQRTETVADFLVMLECVEEELTRPDEDGVEDPVLARVNDRLQGGFIVEKRLGQGSTSVVFRVRRDKQTHALKLAAKKSHNDRIRAEYQVLRSMTHAHILHAHALVEISGHAGILMEEITQGTVAQRIASEGRFNLGLLERFGKQLLAAISYLETQGKSHRDIKPDNMGLVPDASNDALKLVLFDFSLVGTPVENISAGTPAYLDPFLRTPQRRHWDSHAERFSAAMSLYEMATCSLPTWGDGKSDPAMLDCPVTVESEWFDPAVREPLTEFFKKALHRDSHSRYHTMLDMCHAWQQVFAHTTRPAEPEPTPAPAITETYHPEMPVASLGLSSQAMHALERLNVVSLEDLLGLDLTQVIHMRGVGHKTRKEIASHARNLRARFPHLAAPLPALRKPQTQEIECRAMDLIADTLLPQSPKAMGEVQVQFMRRFLGLDSSDDPFWPPISHLMQQMSLTRSKADVFLGRRCARWQKENRSLTALREEIAEILRAQGGITTARILTRDLLIRRGSAEEEPHRTQRASAVTRAAIESERLLKYPRWLQQRESRDMVIAMDEDGRGAERMALARLLGQTADEIADQDPLLSPQSAYGELLACGSNAKVIPEFGRMSQHHLLELAVRCSQHAALSSRLEIYPSGLAAERAFRLAQGAVIGPAELNERELKERVLSRYPESQPLPSRPQLVAWLAQHHFPLAWDPAADKGHGAFVFQVTRFDTPNISTRTSLSTASRTTPLPASDAARDARAFSRRLDHTVEHGGFLVLGCSPKTMLKAQARLIQTYQPQYVDFDAQFIQAMHDQAQKRGIKSWQTVIQADAVGPDGPHYHRLTNLVNLTVTALNGIMTQDHVLMSNLGLLAHYQQIPLIAQWRDQVIEKHKPHTLWLLIPCDAQSGQPTLNGAAIPMTNPNQWTHIPTAWIHEEE